VAVLLALLFLVGVNFTPFLAHLALGERLGLPLDGGRRWRDGRPILGPHKTLRGVLAGTGAGALAGPLIGVGVLAGAAAGLLAMVGDVVTSFAKRRLGHSSGRPVLGLDQALEGALPLAALAPGLGLGGLEALLALAAFIPISYAGAWFWHDLLYRPPIPSYPRIIRATTRLREWRACHQPLAPWQAWLNFESYVYYRVVMAQLFRVLGLYERGVANVLAVQVVATDLTLDRLPAPFDGYRVLLLTDLHLDGIEGLADRLAERVQAVEADLCLIGGDVRMEMYGPMAPALRGLRRVLGAVQARDGVFGVLGNHDCIEMLPELEATGVTMLVNEAHEIRRDGASVWLVGIDDPHYYRSHDLPLAFREVPAGGFSVFLAHSPEVYREAAAHGADLYLCGHTHGGQICLPRIGPVFTHSSAPRFTAAGPWRHGAMQGYTSRGAGASGVPVRFGCPGEVALLTLRRGEGVPRSR
jgi:hypothetical protein